jgi:hypothetical protein
MIIIHDHIVISLMHSIATIVCYSIPSSFVFRGKEEHFVLEVMLLQLSGLLTMVFTA